MDPQREKHLQEIRRLKEACRTTSSPYLQRDYRKRIQKMTKELKTYDRLHRIHESKHVQTANTAG